MNQPYDLTGVLKTLYQWRKPIIGVTIAVALISCIVVMVVPVYYQANTTFYAASQDLFKPEKVFGGSSTDMYYYGSSEDIDRVHTISKSKELTDFLIDSFDLYEHYDINPESSKSSFFVRLQLLGLYDVIQTKYEALILSVEDKDPEVAAAMANAAREKINELLANVIRNSQANLVSSIRESLKNKKLDLDNISDSLTYYRRKYDIYSPENQTEFLSNRWSLIESSLIGMKAKETTLRKVASTRALRDSLSMLRANISALEQEKLVLTSDTSSSNFSIKKFNEAKGQIEMLDEAHRRAISQFTSDKEREKFYKATLDMDIDALHLVEAAEVPIIKHRPKRAMLVIASTLAAFIFSVFGVLLFNAYRHIDWKSITESES